MAAADDFIAAARGPMIAALHNALRPQLEGARALTAADIVTAVDTTLTAGQVHAVAAQAYTADQTAALLNPEVASPPPDVAAQVADWTTLRDAALGDPLRVWLIYAP